MKLIDKDKVAAKIERRTKINKECMLGLRNLDYFQGKVDALNDTLSFLNTLETKDVNEIIKTAEDHAYFAGGENTREKLIDKACEWLSKHFYDKEYEIKDDEGCWIDDNLLITDFRKAMEEKL